MVNRQLGRHWHSYDTRPARHTNAMVSFQIAKVSQLLTCSMVFRFSEPFSLVLVFEVSFQLTRVSRLLTCRL